MSIGRVPGATGIQPSIVTAKGDLIVATASGSVTNQAVGSNNQVLTADSAQADGVKWANGSAATLTTTGDLLYASAANTPARLAIGSTDQVLKVSGGVPVWGAAPASTFIGAYCRKNASQTLTTSTLGAITWQTELYDTNNIHSTSVDTDRFTIPTGLAGYWLISASITFDANTSGGRRLYIFKNGSGGTEIATLRTGAYTSDYLNLQGTAIVSCVAGDYLTVSGWQSSGGNLVVWGDNLGNNVSWISVAYLGA